MLRSWKKCKCSAKYLTRGVQFSVLNSAFCFHKLNILKYGCKTSCTNIIIKISLVKILCTCWVVKVTLCFIRIMLAKFNSIVYSAFQLQQLQSTPYRFIFLREKSKTDFGKWVDLLRSFVIVHSFFMMPLRHICWKEEMITSSVNIYLCFFVVVLTAASPCDS